MSLQGLFGFQLLDLAAPASACTAKASALPGEGGSGDSALSPRVGGGVIGGEGAGTISLLSPKVGVLIGEGGDRVSP